MDWISLADATKYLRPIKAVTNNVLDITKLSTQGFNYFRIVSEGLYLSDTSFFE